MLFHKVLCLAGPHRARLVELRHLVVSDRYIPFLLSEGTSSFLFSDFHVLSLSHLVFPHIVCLRPNTGLTRRRSAAALETYK